MESRYIVNSVCCFSSTFGSCIERRKPERSDPQVIEITGFNHVGDSSKIASLPISPLSSPHSDLIVRDVSIDEAVGHDHVDERILPFKLSTRARPERYEEIVCWISINIESVDFECVLTVLKSTHIVCPGKLPSVPCRTRDG